MKRIAITALVLLSGTAAWLLQRSDENREESKEANIIIAGLGGFRGIIAEAVWFRMDRLQDEGRCSELAQLANFLVKLEPHTPEVWIYAAWNLSYNISVMMPTAEDRWRWVNAGLKLLRDDGLGMNPRSPQLHKEIAWLFLAKIGGNNDEAAAYYADTWRKTIGDAKGDFVPLKMQRDFMDRVDAEYGKQDWANPKASALYWAARGLSFDPTGMERAELRHVLYQTLMLEAVEDERFAPCALKAMREAYLENPSLPLKELIMRFKAKFNLQ